MSQNNPAEADKEEGASPKPNSTDQPKNNGGNNNNHKKKFIVMDIVFYGSSLNYDQGSGNLQELKKITGWDGKQYTLVSRYALRYSLLKTGEQLGLWKVAPGNILERARGEGEGKTVIQPSIKALLSGEILKYPDYDFFGYLITGTTPQNSREAPVKISHAVSLTPYNYDSHFAGNLDLAKRMVEAGKAEKIDPNLFTVEEHQTYYIYTVIIDVDRIGKNEVYLAKGSEIQYENELIKEIKKSEIENEEAKLDKEKLQNYLRNKLNERKLEIKEIKSDKKKEGQRIKIKNRWKDLILRKYGDYYFITEEVSLKLNEINKENDKLVLKENGNKRELLEYLGNVDLSAELNKIFLINFNGLDDKKEKIKNLIKAILNLNRDIKARKEVLYPKLLILGLYEGNYQTFKDRIRLSNAYEEIYEEEIIPDKKNKNKTKVIKRVVKLQKPIFEIIGGINAKNWKNEQPQTIDRLREALGNGAPTNSVDKTKEKNNNQDQETRKETKRENENNETIDVEGFLSDTGKTGIWIYRSPEITIKKSE